MAWTSDLTTTVLVARQAPGSKPQGGLREALRWNPGGSSCRPRQARAQCPFSLPAVEGRRSSFGAIAPCHQPPAPKGEKASAGRRGGRDEFLAAATAGEKRMVSGKIMTQRVWSVKVPLRCQPQGAEWEDHAGCAHETSCVAPGWVWQSMIPSLLQAGECGGSAL